jgi:hypothetical protein
LNLVADHLARGQAQAAMRTTVEQGHRLAMLGAVQHDRLPKQPAMQRLAADLVGIGGHVPLIAWKIGIAGFHLAFDGIHDPDTLLEGAMRP